MSKDPYLQLLRARVNIDVNWPVSIGRILGDRVWPDLGDPRGSRGSIVLPGSFMTGQTRWAVYGGIAAAAGVGLIWTAKRRQGG
jgi:hypothetical protein